MPQLADTTYAEYAHTLVIESTYEYKVHGPYGSTFPYAISGIGPMDLVKLKIRIVLIRA